MFNKNNNDNNPFEVGKKQKGNIYQGQYKNDANTGENQNQPPNAPLMNQPSKQEKQRNATGDLKKLSLIVCFIFFVYIIQNSSFESLFDNNLIIPSNPGKNEYIDNFLADLEIDDEDIEEIDFGDINADLSDVKELVDENYVYSPDDIRIGYDTHPFPIEIPKGEAFTISNTDEGFTKAKYGNEISLTVGTDVKAGVYTIEYQEPSYLRITGDYDLLSADGSGTYYNIPLIDGDIIELTAYSSSGEFIQTFTPQTEYVEYQEGYAGVFVYGLSNFDPLVKVPSDSYSTLVYQYYDPEYNYMSGYLFVNEVATLYGAPGSYFIISKPLEDT